MSRHPGVRRPDPSHLEPWLRSWARHLRVNDDERTVVMYVDVLTLFAGWLVADRVADWDDVAKDHLDRFFIWLQTGGTPCPHRIGDGGRPASCAGYGKAYVNNIGRGMQQFFLWFAAEEELPNPMLGYRIPSAPKPGEVLVPVLEVEQLATLVRDAEKGRDYLSRRNAALLRVFASTGCRLGEITGLRLGDVDLDRRQMLVTGKARKQRLVKFDNKAALALDRYLRLRGRRPGVPKGGDAPLWIGRLGTAMTESGLRQAVSDRAQALGIKLHPHMFRHTFGHNWLDNGGSEGDLVELMGWESQQMLGIYGRSARGKRARRAYDQVDVMRGV